LAIGIAFQSISGMLIAVITGLALKAMNRDSVGNARGERFETSGTLARCAPASCAAPAPSALRSARLMRLKLFSSNSSLCS
jgi:hypothetical protein